MTEEPGRRDAAASVELAAFVANHGLQVRGNTRQWEGVSKRSPSGAPRRVTFL